jgi:protein-tyrosine phosphatase
VGSVGRELAWDGCWNARDLGGLETASGRFTRYGAAVRADNVRHLSEVGWRCALEHGVRTLVDLRFEGEEPGEATVPDTVDVFAVSLFGEHDPERERAFDEEIGATDDVASVFAAGYIRTLEETPARVAAAAAAVADAQLADGIVIHCFAGKDRTGILTALLLGVAGVRDDLIAMDYAASEANVMPLFADWIDAADGEPQRELRQRLARAPAATMMTVTAWLRDHAGGAADYLAGAGLSGGQIDRLRTRLVES